MDIQRYIEVLEKGDAPNAVGTKAQQEDRMFGYITGLRDAIATIENRVGSYGDAVKSLRRTVESLESVLGKAE